MFGDKDSGPALEQVERCLGIRIQVMSWNRYKDVGGIRIQVLSWNRYKDVGGIRIQVLPWNRYKDVGGIRIPNTISCSFSDFVLIRLEISARKDYKN